MATKEVLSQEEISALLQGVDSGDIQGSGAESDSTSKDEFHILKKHRPGEQIQISSYDFLSNIANYEKMPALDEIHERICQNLTKSIYASLHRALKIYVYETKICSYSEYRTTIPAFSYYGLVRLKPLRGMELIIINSLLIFNLVEAYFGGGVGHANNKSSAERILSVTEKRITNLFLENLVNDQQTSWQSTYPLEFEMLQSDSLAHPLSIALDSDRMVVYTVCVEFSPQAKGQFDIVLPYTALEPIAEKLGTPWQQVGHEEDPQWKHHVETRLYDVLLPVKSTLAKVTLPIRDLMHLQVGDVIPFEMPETVMVDVGDVEVMEATFGESKENLALKILRTMKRG